MNRYPVRPWYYPHTPLIPRVGAQADYGSPQIGRQGVHARNPIQGVHQRLRVVADPQIF